ncbi:hypothetical protein [Pendulispora albinea]|uniref:Uncharacterized protein n=1 Tax=Pendulispora albinea TaxID=2741071 RepID=A0ABZ2M150_9BACT
MRTKAACAAAMLALASWAAPASAQKPDIHVRLHECGGAPLDYDTFLDVLRVELAPLAVVPGPAAPANSNGIVTLDIAMPCGSDRELVTFRIAAGDRPPAARLMDIGDLPTAARPRGMAVVAAELVRSAALSAPAAPPSDPASSAPPPRPAEPPPRDPPSPEPPPTDPPAEAPPAASNERPLWNLRAAAQTRIFLAAPATALFGGSLDLHIDRARIGFGLLRGGTEDRLGTTRITLLDVSIGVAVVRVEHAPFELSVTPRIGGGLLLVDASPGSKQAMARSATDSYLDAAVAFDVRLRLHPRVRAWATLDIDLGYARGVVVKADARVTARPEGPFLGFRLGLAFAP